jgi:lipopolysaccharide export system permease protein
MKLIDRHILKNFLVPFAYILISLLGLFLTYDISTKTARFLRQHVPFLRILKFYSLYIPQLIAFGLPMVILLATVLGIGRMSKNNEITAMRACGVSVLRVACPLFLVGLLLAAVGFFLLEKVVTRTFGETRRFEQELKGRTTPVAVTEAGHVVTGDEGAVLTYRAYDPSRRQLEGLSWEEETHNPKGKAVLTADMAVWIEDAWWAASVTIEFPDGTYTWHKKMKMYDWDFRPEEITGKKFAEEMTLVELRKGVHKYKTAPQKVRELQIQVHRRVALPLLNLVVIAVALPFALKGGKRGGSVAIGVGISMLLCLAYYGLTVFLSLVSAVPPWLGVWFPNILFGTGGGIATFRID